MRFSYICPGTAGRRENAIDDNERNEGRLRLKRNGTSTETRFRLSPKRTSPFISAGASVQSTTASRGVRISGSNAGYTMFRGSVKGTGYTLHSPVPPSLPLPCVAMCHYVSTGLYLLMTLRRTLELRVGDCRKSTRHRYSPSSRSSTLFRDRVAGSVTVRKYPRSSRISLSFQCDGTSECFPRTSKLWTNDSVNHSVKINSAVFCLFSRTDQITFDCVLWETGSVSYGCVAYNVVISLSQ